MISRTHLLITLVLCLVCVALASKEVNQRAKYPRLQSLILRRGTGPADLSLTNLPLKKVGSPSSTDSTSSKSLGVTDSGDSTDNTDSSDFSEAGDSDTTNITDTTGNADTNTTNNADTTDTSDSADNADANDASDSTDPTDSTDNSDSDDSTDSTDSTNSIDNDSTDSAATSGSDTNEDNSSTTEGTIAGTITLVDATMVQTPEPTSSDSSDDFAGQNYTAYTFGNKTYTLTAADRIYNFNVTSKATTPLNDGLELLKAQNKKGLKEASKSSKKATKTVKAAFIMKYKKVIKTRL